MLKIKSAILKNPITREITFFLFRKKVYKSIADKNLQKLFDGKIQLSKNRIDNLIVSVTSIPDRVSEIKYMLYSILAQELRPEKIILWLTASQFPQREAQLPEELLKLRNYDIEIRWCDETIRSYTKLIPSLKCFPDSFIAIADDDIYYHRKWLLKLWNEHLKYPENIICHIADKILFDKTGKILSYKKWSKNIKVGDTSALYFPLGYGGVLYQKRLLFKDIEEADLFMKLSPYADDIWFYFMIVLNGHTVRIVKDPFVNMKWINPYKEYNIEESFKLSHFNMDNDKNDEQFKNITDYYGEKYFSLIKN